MNSPSLRPNVSVPTSVPDEAPVSLLKNRGATMFDLPLFIREQIYDYVFSGMIIVMNLNGAQHSNSQSLSWCNSEVYPDRMVPCPTLAIAQTCSFMRAEALSRFYKKAVFRLPRHELGMKQLLEVPEIERCGDGDVAPKENEEKDNAALRNRIELLSRTLRLLHRVEINFRTLPVLGWDIRSWTWSSIVYDAFPNLEELRVGVWIECCMCDEIALASQFDLTTGQQRYQLRLRRDHPSDMADGEFVQRLLASTPRRFRMQFGIDFIECCTYSGTTSITLDPDREPKVELVHWFNFDTCNEVLVRFMNDYGLRTETEKMQKMIDDNEADIIGG